jgi:hypothetical protein
MTLRRALLALSLVAVAAPAAASLSQSAPSPSAPGTQAPAQPAPPQQPSTPSPATRAAAPDEIPVDPLAIAFDISADHDAEDAAGPKLLKYVIDFVPAADAPGKAHTLDLGKPKPVDGSISVPLTKVLVPGTYNAHVRAIGRGLRTSTVTVGPFVITEKIGKTKAEIDKELLAPDKPLPQDKQDKQDKDKRTRKPKTQTDAQPAATAPPDTPADGNPDAKDGSKPARKGGFWKKFYEKVVGDPD